MPGAIDAAPIIRRKDRRSMASTVSLSRDAVQPPKRQVTPLALAAIFFAVSTVTALNYAVLPGDAILAGRRNIDEAILRHDIPAPDRYRFLVPMVAEGSVEVLQRSMPRRDAFDRTYVVFYLLALPAFLASLFAYVRVWFPAEQALVGVLFVAATLPITLKPNEYGPGSFLEPTFVTLALLCILRDRRLWLALLVAVAALNRETGVFLVLLYAAARPLSKQRWIATLAYAGIWLTVFIGVRLYAGDSGRYWTIAKVFSSNLSQLWLTAFNVAALLGVFWWFAAAGFRRAPLFAQRVAVVIPVYLAVIAVWGIWWEVRLLLPLMPLLLPLALAFLFEPASGPLEQASAS
jgi:hypothetical protein